MLPSESPHAVLRWKAVMEETLALLQRNDALLERRSELIRTAHASFREVTAVAHAFVIEAARPLGPRYGRG